MKMSNVSICPLWYNVALRQQTFKKQINKKKIMKMFIDIVIVSIFKQEKFLIDIILHTVEG